MKIAKNHENFEEKLEMPHGQNVLFGVFWQFGSKISFLKKNLAGSFEDTESGHFKISQPKFSPKKFAKIHKNSLKSAPNHQNFPQKTQKILPTPACEELKIARAGRILGRKMRKIGPLQ